MSFIIPFDVGDDHRQYIADLYYKCPGRIRATRLGGHILPNYIYRYDYERTQFGLLRLTMA